MQVLREVLTPYRGVSLAGFVALWVAVAMPWIEWWPASVPDFAPAGPYYVDGLDLDRHGDTLVLLALMGVVTTIFGRAGAAFLLAAAIAALALPVTFHAWDHFQRLGQTETRPAEGYYVALAGSGLALAASLAAWLDGFRRQQAPNYAPAAAAPPLARWPQEGLIVPSALCTLHSALCTRPTPPARLPSPESTGLRPSPRSSRSAVAPGAQRWDARC
jgi:hypothetical protein